MAVALSQSAGRSRDARRAWAVPGSSHDRLIRVTRIGLPAAVGGLFALLTLAPLTAGRDISFVLAKDRVAVAKERLRVSKALYRGEDGKGQPFALTAASAVQVSSSDPVVRMTDLSARIGLSDGPATLVAGHGRYDMDNEKVTIDGPIRFASADGYRMTTRDVLVDLDTRQLESHGPVDGHMPLGTFAADRLSADLESRIVRLDGRARLHIVQSRARGSR